MPTLTQLLAADNRIRAAIIRAEGHRPSPKARRGWRIIVPQRERVTGDIVRTVAWPRYLVWRSYLASRRPTQASVTQAAHRLRGGMLARYAHWAHAHHQPLPTDHTPPTWALGGHPQPHTRATGDNQKDYGEKWLDVAPDDAYTVSEDAAAWWDEFGWDSGLTPDQWAQMTPEQQRAWQEETMAQVTSTLEFDAWLNNVVLSDLQVLQLLETYWNGQTTMLTGQETLGEMGIEGDFNLVDPMMQDFLRYRAGALVTSIDENTRQQLAQTLWSGLGGDAAEGVGPFGMPQLAKYLQGSMAAMENGLMDMSRSRAYLIAVTETARAETFGQFVSMLGTGVQRKVWMTTVGACKICEGNQSMGDIPIRDQFPSGHYAPPGHPRCRCSLAPGIPDGPFNPKDWAWAPDATALQNLFNDPSFAQWPNGIVNLDQPWLQMAPPPASALGDFGRLAYSDLPPGVQSMIDPQAYANNYTDAWNMILQNMGNAVNQAAAADLSTKVAEEQTLFTPSAGGGGVLTLDDILNGVSETPEDLQGFRAQLSSQLDDALSQLGDDLSGLGE